MLEYATVFVYLWWCLFTEPVSPFFVHIYVRICISYWCSWIHFSIGLHSLCSIHATVCPATVCFSFFHPSTSNIDCCSFFVVHRCALSSLCFFPVINPRNKCRISDSFLCIAPFPLIIYFSQVKLAQFELCSTLSEQRYTNRPSSVPSFIDPLSRWKFECANIDQDKWTLSSYPCLEYRK